MKRFILPDFLQSKFYLPIISKEKKRLKRKFQIEKRNASFIDMKYRLFCSLSLIRILHKIINRFNILSLSAALFSFRCNLL